MNVERLVIERLHQDGAGRAPDALLLTTLDKVAVTPQVRLLWPRRTRLADRRRPNRPLFAIAALLVSLGLLGALAIAGGRNTQRPSLALSVAHLAAGRYHLDVQLDSYWRWDSGTPSPAPEVMPLDAYAGRFMGAFARVTFDLPAGWWSDGEEVYKEGWSAARGPGLRMGGIGRVYSDPCNRSGGTSADPLAVWSVEGTALALSGTWPKTTKPAPATVGGLGGLYVEVTTPGDVDTDSCFGQAALYEWSRGGRDASLTGQLDRIWVVDVDGFAGSPNWPCCAARSGASGAMSALPGGIMVIDARSDPSTSQRDNAELQSIVDSIVIEELPPTPISLGGPPLPLPMTGQLDADNYSLANPYEDDDPIRGCTRGCSAYHQIVFNVPSGWATKDGFLFKHLGLPAEVGFKAWTIGGIYNDPCHWHDSTVDEQASIHSEEGDQFHLAVSESLLEQFRATSATVVRMRDGPFAILIEQAVPAALDLSTCDDGEYRTWTEWDVASGANSHHAAGQTDTIYIVDVDRRPLLLDVSRGPAASGSDVAELQELVDTLQIR